MTTPAELRTRIADLSLKLVETGLALQYNPPKVLVQGARSIVSWSASSGFGDVMGRFATIYEYRSHVRNANYNVMLNDGALLQLSYSFERGNLVAHRLCFFPCPITFDPEEAVEYSLEELLDGISLEWQDRVRLRTPVRFDFAPDDATPDHPESHLTMCEEHCRISVHAPVSLGHFVRFVFRHFYPELWSTHEFLRVLALDQYDATNPADFDTLFVGWRRAL
jgi:hypothetical protein